MIYKWINSCETKTIHLYHNVLRYVSLLWKSKGYFDTIPRKVLLKASHKRVMEYLFNEP